MTWDPAREFEFQQHELDRRRWPVRLPDQFVDRDRRWAEEFQNDPAIALPNRFWIRLWSLF